jgi:DNA repair exonuclease SbcCD nuclease subunit
MRFSHTADWQLGLKLRYLSAERAAQLRLLRFQTVRAIGALAREVRADAVLVAGDVLDDNALGRDALQQTSDALGSFGDIPVGLLPGNHDAATEDGALSRLELPPNVRLLVTREPIQIGEALIYPCPLYRRHETDDPTGWLPERAAGEGIRIAVAHGGVINFSGDAERVVPNLIDANRVIAKGFDYLALGDWHSAFCYSTRAWYPGAPEPTRFKETDPGAVLVVDIDGPGSEPRVQRRQVAQTHWLTLDRDLTEDVQVAELRSELEALPERSQTLVHLRVRGTVSMAARDALDELVHEYRERLAYLDADLDALLAQPRPQDLAAMTAEGFMAAGVQRLQSGTDAVDADALQLFYRLQRETSDAAA